jgi:hypothetical protein
MQPHAPGTGVSRWGPSCLLRSLLRCSLLLLLLLLLLAVAAAGSCLIGLVGFELVGNC